MKFTRSRLLNSTLYLLTLVFTVSTTMALINPRVQPGYYYQGYNNVLTATAGEAIMNHRFKAYAPFKGEVPSRINGSLISMDAGPCTAYAIDKLQDRGTFFVEPGEELYMGQVIGEHARDNDLVVNVQKGKKLTNMRAAGSDANTKIAPPKRFSLEEAMEYIQKDEYLEITPRSIRMRKIYLDENDRKRMGSKG